MTETKSNQSERGQEVAYFNGEFLANDDYSQEQSYLIQRRQMAAATLSGWGLLRGLDTTPTPEGGAKVTAGTALDGQGRLVELTQERLIGPPPSNLAGNTFLIISYRQEFVPPEIEGKIGYIRENPELIWVDALNSPHILSPVNALILARREPASPQALKFSDRIYSGAPIGTLSLFAPGISDPVQITGWSRGAQSGLEIRAKETALSGSAGSTLLEVTSGAIGVGTMSPKANLDIAPSTADQIGLGLLTCHGKIATLSSPAAQDQIEVGFTISIIDSDGIYSESKILSRLNDGSLSLSEDLECTSHPYRFRRPLSLRIGNAVDDIALAIDLEGKVSFGSDAPKHQLDIQRGDLALVGNDQSISFQSAGEVTNQAGGSIGFEPQNQRLAIYADNSIAWKSLAGISILTQEGRWGIGTEKPETSLDVTGYIQSTKCGFVFPDGSIQKSAEISVPVGSIIDWWRGNSSIVVPSNYRICNGDIIENTNTSMDGKATPNLASLFVVGVTDKTNTAKLTGTPSHSHNYVTPDHTHGFPHTHPDLSDRATTGANDSDGMSGAANPNARDGHTHPFSAPVGAASQTYTGNNNTAGQTDVTQAAAPTPPYFGLMKLVRVV